MLEAQQASMDDSSVNMKELEDRIFLQVTGEERSGRVRGYGLGLTPTAYYGSSSQGSVSVTQFERVLEESRENKLKLKENQRELNEMKARMDWMATLLQRPMPGVQMPQTSQPSASDSHSPLTQGSRGFK